MAQWSLLGSERYEHVLGVAHNMTLTRIAEEDHPSELEEHPCERLLSLCPKNTPAKPKNTPANKNGGPEHVGCRPFYAPMRRDEYRGLPNRLKTRRKDQGMKTWETDREKSCGKVLKAKRIRRQEDSFGTQPQRAEIRRIGRNGPQDPFGIRKIGTRFGAAHNMTLTRLGETEHPREVN